MATAPVNHTKQDAAPEAIRAAAQYAIQVAGHYVNWLGQPDRGVTPEARLQGRRVLEVGPGSTLGTPVLLACHGARVATADRFLPDWDADFHPAFFTELARQVADRGETFARPISQVLSASSFAAAVDCHQLGAEQLADIGDTFDVVYSNAVLEHVQDLATSAANFARVTVEGGLNFHQVDLRDHRNFDRPLEHLTIPRDEFEALRQHCHCECGALWRASDVAAAFETAGFSVSTRPNMFAAPDYLSSLRPRLRPEFASRSDEDLAAISAFFSMTRARYS